MSKNNYEAGITMVLSLAHQGSAESEHEYRMKVDSIISDYIQDTTKINIHTIDGEVHTLEVRDHSTIVDDCVEIEEKENDY